MSQKITQKKAPVPAKHWILFTLFLAILFGLAGIFLSVLWDSDTETSKTVRTLAPSSLPKKSESVTPGVKTVPTASIPPSQPLSNSEKESAEPTEPVTVPSETKTVIAPTLDIKIPFGVQAPFGNWDLPYQEACEEASSIMAAAFFRKESLGSGVMNDKILKLVQWEKSYFGFYEDTTATQTAEMLQAYFGLDAEATDEVTVERIKRELNLGHVIIFPASGRALENPHFSGTDSFYHMLVIRGYDDEGHFITNDPGTRRGEGFKYTYENILFANHDWTGSKDTIDTGAKRMVIVKRIQQER